MKKLIYILLFIMGLQQTKAAELFINMDETQANHLKAYGIAYWMLTKGQTVDWLLNYKGGSFACPMNAKFEEECIIRGVSYSILADAQYSAILAQINDAQSNMEAVKLEKPPKIAVYSPKNKEPWDDAVTLVLQYAEIPYEVVFDDEVLENKLPLYDWLHLHHEDFTGQYGKFWSQYKDAAWYRADQTYAEQTAKKWGYGKVSQLKLAVAKKIRDFVVGGGYMFAMCSATETFDIALAADGIDICASQFDGDPMDPQAQQKLDFSKTFAFQNFTIVKDPYTYGVSNIDVTHTRPPVAEQNDYFTLFEFSAKTDEIPTMLCQNHTRLIKSFMGQTTAFNKNFVKSSVLVMGENKALGEAKYMHGEIGKGMWTFYGGHDPEDYQHFVGEPPTDLKLHPNSPGYRLILNNVLFPAAKRKKKIT